jgi:hypothetical protein
LVYPLCSSASGANSLEEHVIGPSWFMSLTIGYERAVTLNYSPTKHYGWGRDDCTSKNNNNNPGKTRHSGSCL